jgi:hypothetical protein
MLTDKVDLYITILRIFLIQLNIIYKEASFDTLLGLF